MDVNEGNIPHKKAFREEEIEEERRLLYVALTRAREEVYILYIKENNKNRHKESRYIKECIIENKCLSNR
jgi:DNA helicase-2/ATP-dependent DNA helicase PcrA